MARTRIRRFRPQWSNLPADLLEKIAKNFHTRFDILRFRAVCSSFRSSLPPPPPKALSPYTPLKIPYHIYPNPSHFDHLLLTESTVYAIEPTEKMLIAEEATTTKTWLVKLEESVSGKTLLKEPLHRHTWTKKELYHKLPKSLNPLDFRIKEVTKEYELIAVSKDKGMRIGYMADFIKKVVVSRCLDDIDDEFAVLAIYDKHGVQQLGLWRNGDKGWTDIVIDIGYGLIFFEDIVYHNEKFYALDSSGHVITVNLKSWIVTITGGEPSMAKGVYRHLVKSFEDSYLKDLFLIYETRFKEINNVESCPIHLEVFKIDGEEQKLVLVEYGLEERVLFLGRDCSFCLSAKEFPECKRNCVYLTDTNLVIVNFDHPGWDAMIFDLENEIDGPLWDLPSYSTIFWPPPTWLK